MGACCSSHREYIESTKGEPPAPQAKATKQEVVDVTVVDPQSTNFFGWKDGLTKNYALSSQILGKGAFGVVVAATRISDKEKVAVKGIAKSKITDERDRRELLLEVDILNRIGVGSLNCISLYDTFEDPKNVYIVTELAEGGTLLQQFKSNPDQYMEEDVVKVTRSILQMVAQCHAKHIVHRDIKLENFVYTKEGPEGILKAIDFGMASYHPPGSDNIKETAGTPYYMAPEVINKNYSFECDLWSTGVLVYMLLVGKYPFTGDDSKFGSARILSVVKQILNSPVNFKGKCWEPVSDLAIDFVKKLLIKNPKERMTVEQALDHPWLDTKTVGGNPRRLSQSIVARLQRFSTYGAFKQKAMVYIIRRNAPLSAEEEVTTPGGTVLQRCLTNFFKKDPKTMLLTRFFHALDKDHDMHITHEEANLGLKQAGYNLTEQETKNLWATVDQDADGGVDLEEFIAALLDWSELEKALGAADFEILIRDVFDHFDTDKDGSLQLDELACVLDRDLKSPEVRMLVLRADKDQDGSISFEEFRDIMMDHPEDKLDIYDLRIDAAVDPLAVEYRRSSFTFEKTATMTFMGIVSPVRSPSYDVAARPF